MESPVHHLLNDAELAGIHNDVLQGQFLSPGNQQTIGDWGPQFTSLPHVLQNSLSSQTARPQITLLHTKRNKSKVVVPIKSGPVLV